MFARLLAVAAVAVLATSSASAALISNGSFESGTDPGPSFITVAAGGTSITGWTVGGAGVDYIGGLWMASDGSRSLDLNALAAGSVSQTFATNIGQQYQVTFDLAGNPDGGPGTRTLTASADSFTDSFPFAVTTQTRGAMGWLGQSFTFTASGTSTTLTFSGNLAGGPFGPALDNVAVTAIPEPATMAVFGCLGLAGLGYARRRKAVVA